MTFAASGLAAQTANIINTTSAQATTQVLAPAYGTTGTAQPVTSTGTLPTTYGGAGSGQMLTTGGTPMYAILYGSAAAQLNTPGSIPTQNGYMIPNALPSPGSVNGIMTAPLNVQNQAARPDVAINNTFDFIYQQLITMSTLVYRM